MTTSQNGWAVCTSAPSGTLSWITGRVRPGDVATVFEYLCRRFHAEVEKINPAWSWGWAYRPIRGSSTTSNHASGTALDLNAPAHPLGVHGTFPSSQVAACHKILADLDGVIRWGNDYSGRVDGMHFEVNASAAKVAAVAARIRAGKMPGAAPTFKPNQAKAVHFGRVQEQFLIAAGVQRGQVEQNNGVGLIQQALNKALGLSLDVDGYVGESTLKAWGRWEKRCGVVGRPRVPDVHSLEELGEATGLDVVGTHRHAIKKG